MHTLVEFITPIMFVNLVTLTLDLLTSKWHHELRVL